MLSDFSKIGFVFVFFEPIILFLFTLVLLNIVGFPPFIIFFVKYTVFMLVLNTYGYFVAALLLIFSIFPIFKSFDVLRQLWLFYFPESFKKQQGDLLDLFSADFVESLSRKFKFLLFQKFKDGLSIRNFFFRVDVVILILFKRYIKFFFNFIFLHVFGGSLTNKEVFSDDSFASSTVSLKFVFKSNKLIIYFLSILFVFIILNPAKFQELSLYFANLFAAT